MKAPKGAVMLGKVTCIKKVSGLAESRTVSRLALGFALGISPEVSALYSGYTTGSGVTVKA